MGRTQRAVLRSAWTKLTARMPPAPRPGQPQRANIDTSHAPPASFRSSTGFSPDIPRRDQSECRKRRTTQNLPRSLSLGVAKTSSTRPQSRLFPSANIDAVSEFATEAQCHPRMRPVLLKIVPTRRWNDLAYRGFHTAQAAQISWIVVAVQRAEIRSAGGPRLARQAWMAPRQCSHAQAAACIA